MARTRRQEFEARIRWTGDRGTGTSGYRAYDRTWRIETPGKAPIDCANDPMLGGDPSLSNPEDLLLAALSGCHMLWYLHLASEAGVVVTAYGDDPIGVGETDLSAGGAGRFLEATLRPRITLRRGADLARADALHDKAKQYCFIARSVSFPVRCDAQYTEVD